MRKKQCVEPLQPIMFIEVREIEARRRYGNRCCWHGRQKDVIIAMACARYLGREALSLCAHWPFGRCRLAFINEGHARVSNMTAETVDHSGFTEMGALQRRR